MFGLRKKKRAEGPYENREDFAFLVDLAGEVAQALRCEVDTDEYTMLEGAQIDAAMYPPVVELQYDDRLVTLTLSVSHHEEE